jgi:phosphoribosylformimino-5-aminoimidazole carboxamide ribotide isomerase
VTCTVFVFAANFVEPQRKKLELTGATKMFVVMPAIDLLGGQVVRLTQGRYDAVTVYGSSPAEVARQFERDGATWIHVVDLDGAKLGEPKNLDALKAICSATKCSVQFGGGVRSLPVLERLFELGVKRVVLGTSAIQNPLLAYEAVKAFGQDKIAVAIDVKEGKVAVKGWTETKEISPAEIGKQLCDAGVRWFVYTDILRDGMLTSPNFESIAQFAEAVKVTGDRGQGTGEVKVIASGGVTEIEHIRRLKAMETLGVVGCIVGRAIYEGKLSLKDALEAAR